MMILNKLLPIFVLPLGVVTILIVLGTLKKWRGVVFVALAGLLVASMPAVGTWLIGRLEQVHPRLKVAEAGPADAVLVLGGMLGPSSPAGYLPEWADAVDRFEGGVALVQAGRAPRLLFTGARMPWDGPVETEGAILRRRAIGRGVPAAAIDVTGEVANTLDEAQQTAKYCAEHGIKRIILVTSAWHLPRAVRTFRKAGVEIVPFPVDFRYDARRAVVPVDFLPNAGGLENTELALRECYGIAFYALTGR